MRCLLLLDTTIHFHNKPTVEGQIVSTLFVRIGGSYNAVGVETYPTTLPVCLLPFGMFKGARKPGLCKPATRGLVIISDLKSGDDIKC